ncbi:MBL fold hydrolase [Clostridia bacterium]|nr:MBL fold hydrolase [Clostridia bacterium]
MKKLKIKRIQVGYLFTNCYILYHEESKKAVIIDPGDTPEMIEKEWTKLGLKPEAILLTHGHSDHIMAVPALQEKFHLPIFAGEDEAELLTRSDWNFSDPALGIHIVADHWVKDEEVLSLADFTIKVITTPGHTAGSVCYYVEDEQVLISGDTLFLGSLGRTDLPTSSTKDILDSIMNKLLILPEEVQVYPGHDDSTTIAYERIHNPAVDHERRRHRVT